MRAEFPQISDDFIYFDTAATALKPRCVIDAMADFYAHHYGTVHRAIYKLSLEATERYNAAREKVARFLNTTPEHIVFTRGTTDAINLVANSIQPGDEVAISETEHHSNIVPWQLRGAKLTVMPVDDNGRVIVQPVGAKLISIAHVSNALGVIQPVEQLKGAKIFIDGAQAAPHIPIDVQALDCDFYAFSGHKLYGPTGIGVLYVKDPDSLPPYQGGGDMIERVTFEKTTYARPPLKFEAGTPPIAEAIGLGAAIDFLNIPEIAAHEHELFTHAYERLQQISRIRIIGKPDTSIISFVADGAHPLDIGTLLDTHNIAIRTGHHCAQPTMDRFGVTATCRISFGMYNTLDEVDRFIEALEKILKKI